MFRHGPGRSIRTFTVILDRHPSDGTLTSRELYCLAATACEVYYELKDKEIITVRILTLSNKSLFRLLTATMPATYLASLLANPGSPYADLAGNVEIKRTPFFDAFDPEGLSLITVAFFEDGVWSTAPALPTPEAVPSLESALKEQMCIVSSLPITAMKRKASDEKDEGDIIWGEAKRQKFRCDTGRVGYGIGLPFV